MPNLMVALSNIGLGGALCSTPQSLAHAHCSSAVQLRYQNTRAQDLEDAKWTLHPAKFRNGARTPKMYMYCTSPADGQTPCKVWLVSVERRRCSNAAKTQKRNPLKFAGVPQTTGPISAASGPKFTILWEHVKEICCLTIFPIVDTCLSWKDIARQNCAMVSRWQIFVDFFASRICSEPRAARFRPAS